MSKPKSPYYDSMFRTVNGKTLATKEYSTFCGMKSRIKSRPQYAHLTYDPIFDTSTGFKAFLDTVGFAPSPQHTLERLDNSKGYLIGNMIWATYEVNLRNRRITLKVTDGSNEWPMITYCEEHGINPLVLKQFMAHHRMKCITVEQLQIHGYAGIKS